MPPSNYSPTFRPYRRATDNGRYDNNPVNPDYIPDKIYATSDALSETLNENRSLRNELEETKRDLKSYKDENKKMEIIVTTLQQRLDKYKNAYEKRTAEIERLTSAVNKINNEKRHLSNEDTSFQTTGDSIQLSKKDKPSKDIALEKINTLEDQFKELRQTLLEQQRINNDKKQNTTEDQNDSAKTNNERNLNGSSNIPDTHKIHVPSRVVSEDSGSVPHEEEIWLMESYELKKLENRLYDLQRKLYIRQENDLRKASVKQEIKNLSDQLESNNYNSSYKSSGNVRTSTVQSTPAQQFPSTIHNCPQCYKATPHLNHNQDSYHSHHHHSHDKAKLQPENLANNKHVSDDGSPIKRNYPYKKVHDRNLFTASEVTNNEFLETPSSFKENISSSSY